MKYNRDCSIEVFEDLSTGQGRYYSGLSTSIKYSLMANIHTCPQRSANQKVQCYQR